LIITKLKWYYCQIAFFLLNTIVLIILLNVFLWIAFYGKERIILTKSPADPKVVSEPGSQKLFNSNGAPLDNGKRSPYQIQWFDYAAYEQIVDERHAAAVLDDFFQLRQLGFIYQPWVQFSEPPYNGKLVNIDVDSEGFPIRRTINPIIDQPSVFRIFAFGGSTTFGYNVADEHTWPSFLSGILNERAKSADLDVQVEVINYGRGFYGSSQEMVLLINLLKAGLSPHLVIFMDGVNLGTPKDVPYLTSKIEQMFHDKQFAPPFHQFLFHYFKWLPMIRLTNSLNHKFFGGSKENRSRDQDIEDQSLYVKKIINQFHVNWNIASRVSEMHETEALVFLQPNAFYNYPVELYRRSLPEAAQRYRLLHQNFYKEIKTTKGFIDLSGLFEVWGHYRKAIIDDCHYSPNFNRFLAQNVANHIDLAFLVTQSSRSGESENGGIVKGLGVLAPE
jgi:hypothetical protein